jgi:hypothetical protein
LIASEIACRRVREHPLEKSPTARGTRRQSGRALPGVDIGHHRFQRDAACMRLLRGDRQTWQGTVRPLRGRPVPVQALRPRGSTTIGSSGTLSTFAISSKLRLSPFYVRFPGRKYNPVRCWLRDVELCFNRATRRGTRSAFSPPAILSNGSSFSARFGASAPLLHRPHASIAAPNCAHPDNMRR